MSSTHLEVEHKYDAGPDAQVPDLSGLPGVASLSPPEQHDLEAVYFDTADLRWPADGSRCADAPAVTTPAGT